MIRLKLLLAFVLAAGTCLSVSAATAPAAPSDPFQYKFSFGEEAGVAYTKLVVNHATGSVLVLGTDEKVHQFDASGDPVEFPAVGELTVPAVPSFFGSTIPGTEILIDNSGGPNQGNFYLWHENLVRAYHPDGSPIGESAVVGSTYGPGVYEPISEGIFSPQPPPQSIAFRGLVIAPDSSLWAVGAIQFEPGCQTSVCKTELVEVTPEMVPTGERAINTEPQIAGAVPDGLGHLYQVTGIFDQARVKIFDGGQGFPELGITGLRTSAERSTAQQLAVDPATNDPYFAFDTVANSDSVGFKGFVTAVPADAVGTEQHEVLKAALGLRAARGIGFDVSGQTLYVAEVDRIDVFHREPPSAPLDLGDTEVTEVRSRGAVLEGNLTDGGLPTTYRFEYGPTAAYGSISEPLEAPRNYFGQPVIGGLDGLEPNTTYHVRLVASNAAGTSYGADGTFRTYPSPRGGEDPCPNALARKQTTAQGLPDCRGYELVSAPDTGGYDVESSLVPGQEPFAGFPLAPDKLLYATHSGAVPGPWYATNRGPDPYLATRTENGWVTDYKGLPSNLNLASPPFSSIVGEADPTLSSIAFAGPGLCDPCFDEGIETGIPVRTADGALIQGMDGSLAASVPRSAMPEGKVAKYFAAGGEKLLFASQYAFEPGANTNGDLTVYERDLKAGTTEIVSTDPAGAALSGTISELDVSEDGSRVLVGKGIATDPLGNEYVKPYLHIAGRPGSIDVAPGATGGVLFAGMTADGSQVLFITADQLLGSDTDGSADLYRATIDGAGNLDLEQVTPGSAAGCDPVANVNGEHWNSTGGADCGALPIAGGGGVASRGGAVYFLSPEAFEGQGAADQPNLYLATPGSSPQLVATLEPENPLVVHALAAAATRRTADFQTSPTGSYAAFVSEADLDGADTHGFPAVYRFAAGSGQVDCVSCDRSGTFEAGVRGAAELPPDGLALLEDGRLFFTTAAQLVLDDPNHKKDVYEWVNGSPELISAGIGPLDSGLLTASADGKDVFFFTHDNLAPEEDHNRSLTRIYDAREGGGFFKLPASVPCQASDECHGAGSPLPGPPDIKSSGKTTPGNVLVCRKHQVKRHGKCVKKKHAKKKHRKKHAKKGKHAKNGKHATGSAIAKGDGRNA